HTCRAPAPLTRDSGFRRYSPMRGCRRRKQRFAAPLLRLQLQLTCSCRKHLGHGDIRRDPCCHRTTSDLVTSRSISLECIGAKAPKIPLSLQSAEPESLQKLVANIRGQIGMRMCTCDVRNRRAYACVCRSCKKGVDVARIGPAE